MNKPNKKVTLAIGCTAVGLICLAGGVFAYLSSIDNTTPATIKVGTVDLDDNVKISFNPSTTTKDTDLADNIINEDGSLDNLNPGDIIPASFTIKNTGSKSVVEKTYVYIVFNEGTKEGDSNQDYSDGHNYGTYSNFIDSVSITDANGNTIETVSGVYTDENGNKYKALKFEFPSEDFEVLNGSDEKEQGVETTEVTYNFYINFDLEANVHTEGQTMQIKTFTQSLQYRNTGDEALTDLMDDSAFFTETTEN